MSDLIRLSGLTVHGRHGVFDFERANGQDFVVDVELEFDTRLAARSDALADTVDYGSLAQGLAAVISGEPVALLEKLAHRLMVVCLADDRVAAARVTVHKPQAPIPLSFTDVSVSIHRTRAVGSP
ncbi:MAG: putative dihydroneopterin aldolase [Frankiales bacterium]|nr:putative dihydroneopterin aldolase [Frankiales bacterium]